MNEISEIQKKIDMLELAEIRKELYDKPILKNLFLELTSLCNARCEHCGSSCGDSIPKDEIESEYLKKTLKEIADKYDADDILLNVTGGEPLLRKDLFELMDYAVSLGFHWGITSNGMLINEKMAKKLGKSNMETISISIDGLKDTHEKFRKVPECFDKILAAIKYLKNEENIKIVQVTTVANKKNIDELEELYKLMLDIGVDEWRVVNCDPIGRAKDNDDILLDSEGYKRLFKFIEEKTAEGKIPVSYGCSHYLGAKLENVIRPHYFICSAGLFTGSILSNGDIFVCPNVERRKELIMGNIRKDSFVDVWENRFEPYRHDRKTVNEECKKCSEFQFCGGDSFHTWDFDNNKPNFCIKNIFKEDVE